MLTIPALRVAAIGLLGLLAVPARAQQAPQQPATQQPAALQPAAQQTDHLVDLIFAADLAGEFHGQGCGESIGRPGVGLASLASTIAAIKAKSPATIVMGGGGLLGPGSGARFLLHSVEGSQIAADLIRSAGIDIASPGVQEFELSSETLLGYFDALRRSGAVPLLSNLVCTAAHPELCRALATQHTVTRGGLRIGVLAALPEDAPQRVGPGHLYDAKVAPWGQLTGAAKKLRKDVDLLVIEADLSSRFGLDAALGLARELDAAEAHADVIHVTRQDDPHGGVLSMRLTGGTLLIGSPAGGAGVTRVAVARRSVGDAASPGTQPQLELTAERVLAPTKSADAAPLAERLARERKRMCESWDVSVAGMPKEGLDRPAMTRLVLDAMRSAARAEIALINKGAIADQGLPLRHATVYAVGNVLPFKAQVVSVSVSGKELAEALEKYAGQGPELRLRMAGLTGKPGSLLVNGRALSATAQYRLVTIDFVAAGGNGLLSDKLFPAGKRTIVHDDLRRLVLESLQQRDTQTAAPAPLKLEQRPLWRALVDIGLDVQNVTVHNPDATYDRPQLSRQPSLAYKFDATVRGEMDHPSHFVQLTLRTMYGQSWLRTGSAADAALPMGEDAQKWIGQETADLINALALYSFRGLTTRWPRLPTPYVSWGLESEFNRPDTRTYYHFEMSGAAGLRIALPASISANLGLGVRSELLADRNTDVETERELARARFLVTTTIEMPKRALWPRLGNALLGEFLLTYSFTDPELLRSHELRGIGKLYIELGRPLYLTVGTELYLYRDRDHEAGVALDLNVGLKVVLNAQRQQF